MHFDRIVFVTLESCEGEAAHRESVDCMVLFVKMPMSRRRSKKARRVAWLLRAAVQAKSLEAVIGDGGSASTKSEFVLSSLLS